MITFLEITALVTFLLAVGKLAAILAGGTAL
jgi:hypothetical protein